MKIFTKLFKVKFFLKWRLIGDDLMEGGVPHSRLFYGRSHPGLIQTCKEKERVRKIEIVRKRVRVKKIERVREGDRV